MITLNEAIANAKSAIRVINGVIVIDGRCYLVPKPIPVPIPVFNGRPRGPIGR